MKISILFLLAGSLLLCSAGLRAQTQRIGFVNSSKIFNDLPEAQDATKRLEAMSKPVQDSLQMMQSQLQSKYDEYQKKADLMTDSGKRQAQQEIQDLQQRARDYAQTKDAELAKLREKIVAPLKDKILKAIARIAKAVKYTYVLDQYDQINILLYADPKDDLTNRVLDNLIRGK